MKMMKANLIIVMAAMILVLPACNDEKEPIRIGVNAWPPCEIWYIAEQQGYFENVDVEIIRFSTWSDNMESLYLDRIHITHATYLNAIYYQDKGEEGQIILSSDFIEGSDGLVVRRAPGEAVDLKGKKIAVEVHTDEHFLLLKALDSFGLSEEDVIIISATSAQAKDLFVRGEVDAALTYDPFLTQAAEEGKGEIVWTTRDLPGYMIDVLVAQSKIIGSRKEDLQVVISAWYKAQEYIKNNPNKSFLEMAGKERITPGEFGAFYNSFTFYSKEENRQIFESPEFREKLEEMNRFLYSKGAISELADIDTLYTTTIIEEN